jgi:hypothetical protein
MMWAMESELLALTGVKEVLKDAGTYSLTPKPSLGSFATSTSTSNYCMPKTSTNAKTFPKPTSTPKPKFAQDICTLTMTVTATSPTSQIALMHTALLMRTSP